jgi:hypothetical protein
MLKPVVHEVKTEISGVKKQFPNTMLHVFLYFKTDAWNIKCLSFLLKRYKSVRKSCLYFRYLFSDLNDDSAEDLYSSSRGLTARRNKAWQWIGLHTLRIIVICLKYIFSTLYLVFQILAFNEAPFSKFYTHFLSPANLKPQTLQLFPPNFLFTVPLIWISLYNFEGKFILSGLRNTTLRKSSVSALWIS